MFKIGSKVVYRSEGVCVVTDVRSESFGTIGRAEDYYILTPVSDNKSVVFVPVNNKKLVSYMRVLMSAEEIMKMVSELRNERIDWIEDGRTRTAKLKEIIALGDRRQLVVILNTLEEKHEEYRRSGKKIPSGDLAVRERAIKQLYEEFKVTTDICAESELIEVLQGRRVLKDKQ